MTISGVTFCLTVPPGHSVKIGSETGRAISIRFGDHAILAVSPQKLICDGPRPENKGGRA